MGGKSSMIHHFIKIWFDSMEEPIILSVSEEESERFRRNYEGDRQGFFVCDTRNGQHAAVNLQYVQMAHLLWETGLIRETVDEEHGDWITLHFHNRTPVHFAVEDPVELVDIVLALEAGIIDEIASFTDIDGELLLFDPSTLILLEASAAFVREGERKMME